MEKELLEIVGEELSANSYIKLYEFVAREKRKVNFSNDLRIEIQEKAKLVGSEITGSEFGQWLNSYVANKLFK